MRHGNQRAYMTWRYGYGNLPHLFDVRVIVPKPPIRETSYCAAGPGSKVSAYRNTQGNVAQRVELATPDGDGVLSPADSVDSATFGHRHGNDP
jgi:hypothetical protein